MMCDKVCELKSSWTLINIWLVLEERERLAREASLPSQAWTPDQGASKMPCPGHPLVLLHLPLLLLLFLALHHHPASGECSLSCTSQCLNTSRLSPTSSYIFPFLRSSQRTLLVSNLLLSLFFLNSLFSHGSIWWCVVQLHYIIVFVYITFTFIDVLLGNPRDTKCIF